MAARGWGWGVATRKPCDDTVKYAGCCGDYTKLHTHTNRCMYAFVTGRIQESSMNYINVSFLVLILHDSYVRC